MRWGHNVKGVGEYPSDGGRNGVGQLEVLVMKCVFMTVVVAALPCFYSLFLQ